MWRHQSRVAHARKMLAGGQLGELRLVKMDFSFPIDRTNWRLDPHRGGGAGFDLGCYGINAARLFTGARTDRGSCEREPLHVGSRYDASPMMLRFPRDVVALLDCSFECPGRNRIEIVGTDGALEFPDGVLPRPESELVFRHGESTDTIRFPANDQYVGQIECFCASVAAGRLLDPAEDGLANMKVLDAVGHSWGDGPEGTIYRPRTSMLDILQVVTTTDSKAAAQHIAAALVERRLAACVQVLGPITSTFRWEGKIQTAEEWMCVVKTRRGLYAVVESAIRELHSYEVPEIVATPVGRSEPGLSRLAQR